MNRTANSILDEKFLDIRAKLLEVAADFDRVDRAAGEGEGLSGHSLELRQRLNEATQILLSDGSGRAEQLQVLFSRQFDETWRSEMKI